MREFEKLLLRLKQSLQMTEDQAVAAALGLTKAAFADRKRKGSFPVERLKALAHDRPDLALDVDYVLTGVGAESREARTRYTVGSDMARAELRQGLVAAGRDEPRPVSDAEALEAREQLHERGGFPVRTEPELMVARLAKAARECSAADLAAMLQLALSLAEKSKQTPK